MTIRAVTLGLLVAVLVASVAFLNDWILRLFRLIGNHVPTSVYGLLVLFVLIGNPLLGRLRAQWAFSRRELAVMLSLALVGCGIGSIGLLRNFPNAITVPLQINEQDLSWQRTELIRYVPKAMLPVTENGQFDRTVGILGSGMRREGAPNIALRDVPWDAWIRPAAFWVPMVVLFLGGMIALGLVLHRQWSRHELLSYPIAEFGSLLIDTEGGSWPPIFRRWGFWIALGVVVCVHIVNGYHAYHPSSIEIPVKGDFSIMAKEKLQWLQRGLGFYDLTRPTLFLTPMAFVFFMRSDAALSMGLSLPIICVVTAAMTAKGANAGVNQTEGGFLPWAAFGAYLGMVLMIAYTGRHYFSRLLRQALLPKRSSDMPVYATWACRAYLLCMAGIVALLAWVGCTWTLAILFVVQLTVMMVVIGRISAETGLVQIGIIWTPMAVCLGLLGPVQLGPVAMMAFAIIGWALLMDPAETMLPFVLNSLRLCQKSEAPVGRTGGWMGAALGLALIIGVPAVLWTQYNYGRGTDEYSAYWAPHLVFDAASRQIDTIRQMGQLDHSQQLDAWQRLTTMQPNHQFLWSMGIGLVLVVAFGAARLRWTWWPLHPVLFVVIGSWAMGILSLSVLLGWILRTIVVKVGGTQKLTEVRPIAVGVIAGDLMGGLIFMIVGIIYYWVTGTTPADYNPYSG